MQAFLEAERMAGQKAGKASDIPGSNAPTMVFTKAPASKQSLQPAPLKHAREELEATAELPAKPTATK